MGVEVIRANPAFTSKLGYAKYGRKNALTVDQAAALAIGRRGFLSKPSECYAQYSKAGIKTVANKKEKLPLWHLMAAAAFKKLQEERQDFKISYRKLSVKEFERDFAARFVDGLIDEALKNQQQTRSLGPRAIARAINEFVRRSTSELAALGLSGLGKAGLDRSKWHLRLNELERPFRESLCGALAKRSASLMQGRSERVPMPHSPGILKNLNQS